MSIPAFHAAVVKLRREFSASITSLGRTTKRNRAVGGNPRSFHLSDLAADVVCDNAADTPTLIAAARAAGLDAVNEGDHIHLEADPRTPKPKG